MRSQASRGVPEGFVGKDLYMGSCHAARGALREGWPLPVDPRNPSGGPGTIPVCPRTFPVTVCQLPIYKSSPPDPSGTPRDIRDLIWDSEQHSVITYKSS